MKRRGEQTKIKPGTLALTTSNRARAHEALAAPIGMP
jgi:hypothetical protein